jgi:ATP synthase I chain
MVKIDDSVDSSMTELRVFRAMAASVAFTVLIATVLAPWRVTAGLLLGGSLSLLNYHWLRSSVAAVFDVVANTEKPRVKAWRYIVRYFVVGALIFTADWLKLISLTAAIAGLCAFVPALFVEAGREFYFAIIHREESF